MASSVHFGKTYGRLLEQSKKKGLIFLVLDPPNQSPETAGKLGIKNGDWVYIENKRGRIRQKASLSTDVDPRVAFVDSCWWFPENKEAELYNWAESNYNILTDDKPPYNPEVGSVIMRGILGKVYKAS